MNKQEMMKRAEEISRDAEFMEAVRNASSDEQLAELFASRGIEVSEDEIRRAINHFSDEMDDGELNEDALENVAGGIAIPFIFILIAAGVITIKSKKK